MEGIFIVGFLVLGIYKLFALFVRRRERMAIIERLENKDLAEWAGKSTLRFRIDADSDLTPALNFTMLRICVLAVGLGLGMFMSGMSRALAMRMGMVQSYNDIVMVQFGVMMLCTGLVVGLGFLIEYWIRRKYITKQQSRRQEPKQQ